MSEPRDPVDPMDLLRLEPAGDGRYAVPLPEASPEGGAVVYGGQLMAQMIMASAAEQPEKYVKSMSTIFSRAGSYGAPIEVQVDGFHSGRTWASQLVTAVQGGRLLTRAMVLLTAHEPDLIAHQIDPPAGVGKPDDGDPTDGIVFPGAEVRTANQPDDGDVAELAFWTRLPGGVDSLAASQAIAAYDTNGALIGLSMRRHGDLVRIEDAHHTLSTGVIGHRLEFHREFDASSWLLVTQQATFAGKGRVYGRGEIFTEDGTLVATFAQDSMLKTAPNRGAAL